MANRTALRPPDATETAAPPEASRRSGRFRPWLQKLALLAATAALCLGLLEVGFRLAGYEPIYSVYSKPEMFWEHDRTLGWVLQPGARGTYVGPRPFPVQFRAPVRINSLGLRGGEIEPLPPGGRRVLLLGDSQAAGFEVAEEATYAARAEQRLGDELGVPVQVVNAGVRGYGTDQSLLWYERRGRDLDPDLVVLHATANDPEDNTTLHRMRRPFGKAAFALRGDGSLDTVGYPIPRYPLCSAYRLDDRFRVTRIDGAKTRAFCWAQTRLADHSAFLTFVSSRIERNPRLVKMIYGLGTPDEQDQPVHEAAPASPDAAAASPHRAPASSDAEAAPPPASPTARTPPPQRPEPAEINPALGYAQRLTTALILRLASDVHADGAGFVLLIDDADLRALDEAALRAAGVTILRANEALEADQAPFRFPNDGHLNEEGHRRMADFLAPRLAAELRS